MWSPGMNRVNEATAHVYSHGKWLHLGEGNYTMSDSSSHMTQAWVWKPRSMRHLKVMSNSVRPHRRQPTRLPRPWDSPGKNTGVGCHFLLQCMKVKSQSEVAQSCPTLSDPMDCSLPGSSDHGIFQARVLEWGAIALGEIWNEWNLFAIK